MTGEYVYCLVQSMQTVNVFCVFADEHFFFIFKDSKKQMSCTVCLGLDSAVICPPCYKSFVLSKMCFVCSCHFRRSMTGITDS